MGGITFCVSLFCCNFVDLTKVMKIGQVLSGVELLRLKDYITRLNNIVITCHLTPDGDALGAALGLMHALETIGKTAHVVVPDTIPKSLHFMPGARGIVTFTSQEEVARNLIDRCGLLFCVDFNDIKRIDKLGPVVEASKAAKVMIDHHLDPQPFCDLTISYSEMSSTCELIFRALMGMGMLKSVNRKVAECLYTGMITDTGNFTYNCPRPDTLCIAAELVARGINKDKIYNLAMNTSSPGRLRIIGHALAENMELLPEARGALITLDKSELERYNYQKGDTEGLVNKPLQVPDVRWSVFLREDATCVKVSMRSQGDFAVDTLCSEYFGGGGHLNAAGGEFYGTLPEAVDKVRGIAAKVAGSMRDKQDKQTSTDIKDEKN